MHDKTSSQIMFQSIKQKSSFRSFTEKKPFVILKGKILRNENQKKI